MPHPSLRIASIEANAQRSALPLGAILDDASIGRIEEWVVSTLDSRKLSRESEWIKSLDGLSLTKRSSPIHRGSSGTPATSGGWTRFRLSRRKGVAIVSLTDQSLIKEEDLFELTGDLLSLVEAGHQRVVLDFFAVERLSSWAANAIDQAVRRCVTSEGSAVKFSGVCPDVATIFAMTGLDRRVAAYPDTASAVASCWPDLPELRPLPVSILTALMRAEEVCPQRPERARSPGHPHLRPPSSPTGRAVEDSPIMIAARLIVQDGPSMGRPVAIKGKRFVIGRGPSCQLKVGSATVSRSHAVITQRSGRFYLRDLASTNGTLLNGRTLRDREAAIQDGDSIQVGKMTFGVAVGSVLERTDRLEHPAHLSDRTADQEGFEENPDSTEEFLKIGDLSEEVGVKFEVIEGTLIVTPMSSELDAETDVNNFRDALLSLYRRKLPRRVVVNLTHVGHLSGRAIGVLVAHHLRLDRSGGALRVCLANPRVAVVLEQVKLGMLIDYLPTIEDAVIAAWPQPVGVATC